MLSKQWNDIYELNILTYVYGFEAKIRGDRKFLKVSELHQNTAANAILHIPITFFRKDLKSTDNIYMEVTIGIECQLDFE